MTLRGVSCVISGEKSALDAAVATRMVSVCRRQLGAQVPGAARAQPGPGPRAGRPGLAPRVRHCFPAPLPGRVAGTPFQCWRVWLVHYFTVLV